MEYRLVASISMCILLYKFNIYPVSYLLLLLLLLYITSEHGSQNLLQKVSDNIIPTQMAQKTITWGKKKPAGMGIINSLLLSFTSVSYTKAEYFTFSKSEHSFREVWRLNWLSLFHSLQTFKDRWFSSSFASIEESMWTKVEREEKSYADMLVQRCKECLNSLLKITSFKRFFCLRKRWIHACRPQVCVNSGVNTWLSEPSTQANFRCLSRSYRKKNP